jgi:uroporphyrinogen decarboxylase
VPETSPLIAAYIRAQTGDEFFLMRHGDATLSIPDGEHMAEFCYRLADEPRQVKAEAERARRSGAGAANIGGHGGLDGFALCADYCFNTGPFLSPTAVRRVRDPLPGAADPRATATWASTSSSTPTATSCRSSISWCRPIPHALHSLDPQGGVDIAEVKRLYGDRVCLIGNVNCGLLDTGTEEEAIESARYALRHGMPGGGYIFSHEQLHLHGDAPGAL